MKLTLLIIDGAHLHDFHDDRGDDRNRIHNNHHQNQKIQHRRQHHFDHNNTGRRPHTQGRLRILLRKRLILILKMIF
jgi:hypothetical protein